MGVVILGAYRLLGAFFRARCVCVDTACTGEEPRDPSSLPEEMYVYNSNEVGSRVTKLFPVQICLL